MNIEEFCVSKYRTRFGHPIQFMVFSSISRRLFCTIKQTKMSQETINSNLSFVRRDVPNHPRSHIMKNYFLILDKYNRGDEDEEETRSKEDLSVRKDIVNMSENGTQTILTKASKTSRIHVFPAPANQKKNIIIPNIIPKRSYKVQQMSWNKWHRLSVVYRFLDELERDFPAICTVCVIGKSVEGRDIRMLKVSNSCARNNSVWLDASIHSREWITTSVVTYIADKLVRSFDKHPSFITGLDWYIVPVLNPDGYEYTHTKDRMWRKNRAVYEGQRVGVDLNRNFSYGWGNNGDEGSSDEPNNVFYRGPAPFSEPETAAVRDTILGSGTKFKVFLSFHSYFELIIFPWGYKSDPCPDYFNLLEGGIAISRAILNSTGKTYKVGSTKDLTYYACGTSTDWSYAVADIPYSYMIELRSRRHKFKLPKDQIITNCTEMWDGVQSLMRFVDSKRDNHKMVYTGVE